MIADRDEEVQVMKRDDAFQLVCSDEGQFGVEFSGEFLSSSEEEQMEQLKALLRKRMAAPVSDQDISKAAAENEIAILLIETFLAKLRRGERIEKDTTISLDFDALEMPFNTWN